DPRRRWRVRRRRHRPADAARRTQERLTQPATPTIAHCAGVSGASYQQTLEPWRLRRLRYRPPELAGLDPFGLAGADSEPGFFAGDAGGKHFLHRCPIGFDPAALVAAITMWRNADLGEPQSRAAGNFHDIEDRDRVMVRPPAGC